MFFDHFLLNYHPYLSDSHDTHADLGLTYSGGGFFFYFVCCQYFFHFKILVSSNKTFKTICYIINAYSNQNICA